MSEIDEKVEEAKKHVEAIDFVEIGRNALAIRKAAFSGAASITEKALYEYQQKVIDILGEDKAHDSK